MINMTKVPMTPYTDGADTSATLSLAQKISRSDGGYFILCSCGHIHLRQEKAGVGLGVNATAEMARASPAVAARGVWRFGRMITKLILGLLAALPGRYEVTAQGRWAVHIDYDRARNVCVEIVKDSSSDECLSDRRSDIDCLNPSVLFMITSEYGERTVRQLRSESERRVSELDTPGRRGGNSGSGP